MIARQLRDILCEDVVPTSISRHPYDDIVERFDNLERYRLLPKSWARSTKPLSPVQIAAAILSIVAPEPVWAGVTVKTLLNLRPVGGSNASFCQRDTLGSAISDLVEDISAEHTFIELHISDDRFDDRSYGMGMVRYKHGETEKVSHYVSPMALSLLADGAESTFDPNIMHPSVYRVNIYRAAFFDQIRDSIKEGAAVYADGPEAPEPKENVKDIMRRLNVRPGARFMNLGVDHQVTWPNKETVIEFSGHNLVLLPKSADNSSSIHIELQHQRLSQEEAMTLANRFLSMLTWCSDQFSVLQGGWSGNPIPVAVPKRDLAFTTAYYWAFDRKIPTSPESQRALAIYREARNAQQNHQVPYAVLAYYKIIELRHKGKSDAKRWFRENFEILRQNPNLVENVERFEVFCGTEQPHDHLYRACRTAVAHANKPYSIDADSVIELRRLHVAADVLRALARLFISREFGVSDCMYDGS